MTTSSISTESEEAIPANTTHDAAREMRAIRDRWRSGPESPYPEERWFDSLELETTTTAGPAVAFVFRDRYGQRFGWQWRHAAVSLAKGGRWRELLAAHLQEDLISGRWSLPDSEGIRWLVSEGR